MEKLLNGWQGDFGDREGKRSIILEAIGDQSLHIWHMFFGLLASNNDLNVFDWPPLIMDILTRASVDIFFQFMYLRYYLLADGIYLSWSCFVHSIHQSENKKRAHFAKQQEACYKDVEHCFGVL